MLLVAMYFEQFLNTRQSLARDKISLGLHLFILRIYDARANKCYSSNRAKFIKIFLTEDEKSFNFVDKRVKRCVSMYLARATDRCKSYRNQLDRLSFLKIS